MNFELDKAIDLKRKVDEIEQKPASDRTKKENFELALTSLRRKAAFIKDLTHLNEWNGMLQTAYTVCGEKHKDQIIEIVNQALHYVSFREGGKFAELDAFMEEFIKASCRYRTRADEDDPKVLQEELISSISAEAKLNESVRDVRIKIVLLELKLMATELSKEYAYDVDKTTKRELSARIQTFHNTLMENPNIRPEDMEKVSKLVLATANYAYPLSYDAQQHSAKENEKAFRKALAEAEKIQRPPPSHSVKFFPGQAQEMAPLDSRQTTHRNPNKR